MSTTTQLFIDSYLDYIENRFVQQTDKNKSRNLAFEIFSISVILGKSFDEVYTSIQTKDDAFGFDGFYIDEQLDGSYIQYVFQCKNTTFLKQNELNKFADDYEEIFTKGNPKGIKLDASLKNAYDEYADLTKKRCVIIPHLIFLFNGDKNDKESQNNKLFEMYNKPGNFEIFDANDLYKTITDDANTKRKDISFSFMAEKSNISPRDAQSLYSYSILNIKAANFRVSAQQICEFIENEKKING